MVLAAQSPGIPVLTGYDRFHVGVRAAAAFGTEILVLDDGFQCHPLERDVDVVAIDGQSCCCNRWLLPCGPRRELVRALRARATPVPAGLRIQLPEEGQRESEPPGGEWVARADS